VVALARRHEKRVLVCVVPRLALGLLDASGHGRVEWEGQVHLPKGFPHDLRDVVTGARRQGDRIVLAELFDGFPVALLSG
jgi:maltooligosyltrehalose synthase